MASVDLSISRIAPSSSASSRGAAPGSGVPAPRPLRAPVEDRAVKLDPSQLFRAIGAGWGL